MNARRFKARSSREALMAVRQAFGDDAVVLSTRPCAEGVEVLAMAPESLQQIERVAAAPSPAAPARAGVDREREARATRITNAAEAPAIEVTDQRVVEVDGRWVLDDCADLPSLLDVD